MKNPAIYNPQSITVNLTPESDKRIRDESKRTGKSMNLIINEAVREYFERNEKQ